MKLLLDESIPRSLIASFPSSFDVRTVPQMGWAGIKNGELLALAQEHNFQGLITADRGIEYQQNTQSLSLIVVILLAHRTHVNHLAPLVPGVIELLENTSQAGVYRFSE